MAQLIDSETAARLRSLFDAVEHDIQSDRDGQEPHLFSSSGNASLLFRGRSLSELRALQYDLSQPALRHGGIRPKPMQALLIRACGLSRDEGVNAAIAWMENQLDAPPAITQVVMACPAYVGDRDFAIGGCRIVHDLPPEFADSEYIPDWMTPPLMVADVPSLEQESARLIASNAFDDALAILNLGDPSPSSYSPEVAIINPDGSAGWMSGSGGHIFANRIVNPTDPPGYPPLWPEYQRLSDVAALAPSERPDWGGRVLAAARWIRTAESTTWPAQALAASVTALECLFVESRSERNKGNAIAQRLTRLVQLQGHTEESQREWLRAQYQRRNDAVHEGATIREELDVEQLQDLTRYAARWAVWHLTPFHRLPNEICETFADAFDIQRHTWPPE